MKTGKLISGMGIVAMTVALYYGFAYGNFGDDGSKILANPWGIVSLVDLYTGFVLFSMWIAFREKSKHLAVIWISAMMILGFFAGSIYVLISLIKSNGDWLRFFLGWRKEALLNKRRPAKER